MDHRINLWSKIIKKKLKSAAGLWSGCRNWSLWETHTHSPSYSTLPKTQSWMNHMHTSKSGSGMHIHKGFLQPLITLIHSSGFLLSKNTHTHTHPPLPCSWTGLQGYYFQPNYYLTSLSPADPAPPLFLWGASFPEAQPHAPPYPPVSQQHHSLSRSLPPFAPYETSSSSKHEVINQRLSARDLTRSGSAVRSSIQDTFEPPLLSPPSQR